ncbi:hypothetical protein fugu_015082 [Takifugu bimaculatus]|uniref:Protein kinase domain-containing protein n=1 Tax=Takifugu bimaculatus TaxID=433685 RepID=A0A4Z2BZF1_9TELE|nr:hypothetical protein fugu_015082 [Takifugu bimaculatus]
MDDPADEMAVWQRIFNSTSPFSGSTQDKLKGSCPSCSADQEAEEEEGQDSKMEYAAHLNPLINKLLTHGTAEQVGEMPLKTSTFIAQAECNYFPFLLKSNPPLCVNCTLIFGFHSPSSEHNNVACPTPASVHELSSSSAEITPRKKARRKQKRKGRKKVEKKKEKKRQRHRTPSGVPEQESGCSLVQVESRPDDGRNLGVSHRGSVESSEERVRGPSFYERHIYPTGSSCSPLEWEVYSPISSVHSYRLDSDSDHLSSVGDCSLALAGLRGCVSQSEPCYAGPFFKEVKRDEREEEDERSGSDSVINEGIIFYNEKIQPVDSEYKEGREYILSEFIKEGSYGEVHSAQDVNTGFKFAVKKIAMKRFNSEEVGAWSTLRSPCVAELFGVVREGPYVLLFMDLKAGSLGQLIMQRGRLPEDLGLHYQLQILTALEYLAKKKVVHLDIKADNVLLSEDGRDACLCDFGHAERLDNGGQSLSGSKDLKGSETHMAPEIVKGEPRGAKADVWSSCCMFLHMLSGCQPWTRYYSCRLYLKIASDPPPLREIPPNCSHLTFEVLKAGLQKDPAKRSSASSLKEKTARALEGVGGLVSPVKGPYAEPLYFPDKPPDAVPLNTSCCEEEEDHKYATVTTAKKAKKLGEDNEGKAESKHCPMDPSHNANVRARPQEKRPQRCSRT